jgi:hypothetical protein
LEERPTNAVAAGATGIEPLDLAEFDRERHEQDRSIRRGYDYDATAPSHAEFLERQRHHSHLDAQLSLGLKPRPAAPLAPLKIKPGHPPPRSGRPFQPTRSRSEMLDCEAEMDDRDEEYRERDRSWPGD